jgi:hypothetical protein
MLTAVLWVSIRILLFAAVIPNSAPVHGSDLLTASAHLALDEQPGKLWFFWFQTRIL